MNQHGVLDELNLADDWFQEPAAVHLATGMIAGHGGLGCAEAYDHLHGRAVDTGRPLVEVARGRHRRHTHPPLI